MFLQDLLLLLLLLLVTCCKCRVLIYEPVMEGRFVPAAASDKQLAGSAATAPDRPTKPSQPAAKAAAPAGPEEDNEDNSSSNSSSQPLIPGSKVERSAPSAVALTAACHSQTAPVGQQETNSNGKEAPAVAAAAAPAVDIRQSQQQRMLRRLAALQATFASSGLWHLMIFYYATGLVTPHWFLFFSVQVRVWLHCSAVQG
jgi:hypothetical protein